MRAHHSHHPHANSAFAMRSAAPKARDGQSSGVSGELLATLDGGVAGRTLHQRAEALGDRPRATTRSSTSRSSDCSDCRYANRPQPEQALPISRTGVLRFVIGRVVGSNPSSGSTTDDRPSPAALVAAGASCQRATKGRPAAVIDKRQAATRTKRVAGDDRSPGHCQRNIHTLHVRCPRPHPGYAHNDRGS